MLVCMYHVGFNPYCSMHLFSALSHHKLKLNKIRGVMEADTGVLERDTGVLERDKGVREGTVVLEEDTLVLEGFL